MKARCDEPKKIQPEYHLIITEEIDTEPAYFGFMRDIINSTYSDRIQLGVHGAGDNTLSLFQKAKSMAASSANGYKHVWIVYDTDDFPADHINKTAELCVSESTEETTYHAIWSNQCIELGSSRCFLVKRYVTSLCTVENPLYDWRTAHALNNTFISSTQIIYP